MLLAIFFGGEEIEESLFKRSFPNPEQGGGSLMQCH
jgi:hypothetical protein